MSQSVTSDGLHVASGAGLLFLLFHLVADTILTFLHATPKARSTSV